MSHPPPIVYYDGTCLLCSRSVRWILRHDRVGEIRFARLDSQAARDIPAELRPPTTEHRPPNTEHRTPSTEHRTPNTDLHREGLDSILYQKDGQFLHKSRAIFEILCDIRTRWRWVRVFSVLPRSWTDRAYDFIARRRHRWFGKDESCPLPDPAQTHRFLD